MTREENVSKAASDDMSGSVAPIGGGTSNVRGGNAARDDASAGSPVAVMGSKKKNDLSNTE